MIMLLVGADGHSHDHGHGHGVTTGLDGSIVALLVVVAVLAIVALGTVVRNRSR